LHAISVSWYCHIYHLDVFFFKFIITSHLLNITSLSVCTSLFHNTVTYSRSHTGLGVCTYHFSVVLMPNGLHTE
jgi:hypothetical protein